MTYRFIMAIVMLIFLLPVYACSQDGDAVKEPVFKKIHEMGDIKPQAPAKIKLKRNAQGQYSWDISGSDAERIIEEDRKLKTYTEKSSHKDQY